MKTEKQIFQELFNVSRETMVSFEMYREFLFDYQKKVNLIGRGTIGHIWTRHFADSAKFYDILKSLSDNERRTVADLGSGAGFPGAVVAILGDIQKGCFDLTLIESNSKKSLFLEKLKNRLGLDYEVQNIRSENLKRKFSCIMARAVSPLKGLIPNLMDISYKNSVFILAKGRHWKKEVEEIKKEWHFKLDIVKNNKKIDSSNGVTLIFRNLEKIK